MSGFKELIAAKPAQAVCNQRKTALIDLNNKLQMIASLSTENPNSRVFSRVEEETNEDLVNLKKANRALISILLKGNPNIESDDSFKSDQKDIRDVQFKCISDLEAYTKLLEGKGLILPHDPNQGSAQSQIDLSKVLNHSTTLTNQLICKQDENIEKLLKQSGSSAPKPSQPFFTSKQNDTDYAAYKDFHSRFEHFVKKVSNDADKLEWLKSSIKGEAANLIKNFSLSDSNYKVALQKLEQKYLNPAVVRHSIIQSILNFKCESGPRYSKVESAINNLANDLEELKNIHKLDIGAELCTEILRELTFYRLPPEVRLGLIDACNTNYPSFPDILNKINTVIEKLNIGKDHKESKNSQNSNPQPKSGNLDSNDKNQTFSLNPIHNNPNESSDKKFNKRYFNKSKSKDPTCVFCGEKHFSSRCTNVVSRDERIKILSDKRKSSCKICWSEHTGSTCPSQFFCKDASCKSAHGPHACLLCPKNLVEQAKPHTIGAVTNINKSDLKAVALSTAMMVAHNSNALKLAPEKRTVALMLDSGGQRTLVTREVADRLGFEVIGQENACLQGFGAKHGTNNTYDVVSIKLGRITEKHPICIDAFVVPKLNKLHMAGASKFARKLNSKGFSIADWRLLNSKSDIISFDILIGSDFYYKIVNPFKLPIFAYGMWLPYTVYGDVLLLGKIPGSAECKSSQAVNYVNIQNIACEPDSNLSMNCYVRPGLPILDDHELVQETNAFEVAKELNNMDSLGFQVDTRQDEDQEALTSFHSNMSKDSTSNKYIVGFPWVNNRIPTQEELDSNYAMVLARFKDTMKSLDKDKEKLRQYAQTHENEVKYDFIEKMPLDQLFNKKVVKHYINHFPVWRKESATSKCRRVFDASLHRRGHPCLNDKLRKGSQMTPHIMQVMMRIRLKEFLLTSDISKAFLRMVLREADRNFTLFFARDNWMDSKSPITVWRFKSVLFGASSSPFLLNCTVADILASNEFDQFLEVFVDNLFVLMDNHLNIIPSAEKLLSIFSNSSMPLHEFASNCPAANFILEGMGLKTNESMLKVLGMLWDYEKDVLFVKVPEFETTKVTKRSLLSDIAKIYDILGFLGPLVVLGRLLVQEAWENGWNWDAVLPGDFVERWCKIVIRIQTALAVPIPRWIGFHNLNNVSVHIFTDASERALGVVAYLVNLEQSKFFSSKPKVCPINMAHFTTPRKELAAFALGVKHLIFIIKSLSKYSNTTSFHIWSDSTLSLTWCSANKSHKDMFIRSRVDDVQVKLAKYNIQMHYILNHKNPADLLTKDSGRSLQDPLWQNGPPLLLHPERWHIFKPTKSNLDAIPIFCGQVALGDRPEGLPDPMKFDTLMGLLSATIELLPNIKRMSREKALVLAELQWIKWVQDNHYADVLKFIKDVKGHYPKSLEGKMIIRTDKLHTPPICFNLHLFLDQDGVIRIHTSLANCPNLTYDQKFPILLPAKDSFTNLVIVHNHILSGHLGLNNTRSQLRHRFWIPKDTSVIKSAIQKCSSCNTERGQRYHVPGSPDLPEFRFDIQRPWHVTFLDMTGHMFFKDDYGNANKAYFIVFVCASTGSGHIELSIDASSEAFANSFERFCARKGVPALVISDHGSNFRGFQNDLLVLSNKVVKDFLNDKGISWKNTPIGDPHFNGYCERHLGILKSIMKKAVRNRLLTLDQLHTVACYAEGLFNERPLSVMDSSDPNSVPITPNTLVYGRSLRHFDHSLCHSEVSDPDFVLSAKSCEKKHRKLITTLASVKKVWTSEYLGFLARKDEARQKGSPYSKSIIKPKVNDWVLIKDDSKSFRIGRILSLIYSDDNEIRSVKLKTSSHEGVYPVTNLRYLEFHKSDESEIPSDVKNSGICNDIVDKDRPKRTASIKANMAMQQYFENM